MPNHRYSTFRIILLLLIAGSTVAAGNVPLAAQPVFPLLPASDVQAHLSAWAPDGRSVAVVVAREPALSDADLWLVQSDGTRQLIDAHGPRYWVTNPLWSPDGALLAYVRAVYDEQGYGPLPQLWLYDPAVGQTTLLTDTPTFRARFFFGQTRGLAWATDGHSLQFVDEWDGGQVYQVEVMSGRISPLRDGVQPSLLAYAQEVQHPAGRAADGDMVKPVDVRNYDGKVGQGYTTVYQGDYWGHSEGSGSHPGVDISWYHICGTPIVAMMAGVVTWRRDGSGSDQDRCDAQSGINGGNAIVIRHDNIPERDGYGGTVYAVYLHLRDAPTISGTVEIGTAVGLVGSTGYSTGAHLHFQLDRDTSLFHPWWWSSGLGCDVDNTTCQALVEHYTWNPMRFVQAHLANGSITRTPTPTATRTPTLTPTATSTPIVTATPTPPDGTHPSRVYVPLFWKWAPPS